MDNLTEQIINITKAGTYDAIAPHLAEVKEQNNNFRKALNDVLDVITKAPPSEIVDNPAAMITKMAGYCLDALRNNKPL